MLLDFHTSCRARKELGNRNANTNHAALWSRTRRVPLLPVLFDEELGKIRIRHSRVFFNRSQIG
jgi:hypothetical protein